MTQLNEGNETSAREKAKQDKLKIIANKEKVKLKPERFYMSVYKNGKLYLPYLSSHTYTAMEFKKQKYIDKFPNDSITFSKIKEL